MKRICYGAGKFLFRVLIMLMISNLALCFAGIRPMVVVSGSMEPAIRTGSMSWVLEYLKPEGLKKGDIAAFERNDGQTVLHRVVKNTGSGYVTKGDANEKDDPGEVRYSQIKGRVLFSVPCIGWIFMKKDRRMAFIFINGSMLSAGILMKILKDERKNVL